MSSEGFRSGELAAIERFIALLRSKATEARRVAAVRVLRHKIGQIACDLQVSVYADLLSTIAPGETLDDAGVRPLRPPSRSPDLERFATIAYALLLVDKSELVLFLRTPSSDASLEAALLCLRRALDHETDLATREALLGAIGASEHAN